MRINGHEPELDGWVLTGLSGWRGGLPVRRAAVEIAGLAGVLPASQQTAGARSITCTFSWTTGFLRDRDAACLRLQDACRGAVSLRFDDALDRVVRAEASPVVFRPVHENASMAVAALDAVVTFTCYDGASYDAEPRVLALATSPTEVLVGDLPSIARITWGGAWSAGVARTIIVRDVGGAARQTMTFTAPAGESLGATDHHEIDSGRRYVTKVTSGGTRTNEYDWYTSGAWLALDPAWQDRASGRGLTLEISAGTAQLVYRCAYAL